jgi:hypothetical protein
MTTKSSEEKRREREKAGHIEKRIEHMLTHFLYAVCMYHSPPPLLSLFQGALIHTVIHRGLTIKYKLESVEKKKGKEN